MNLQEWLASIEAVSARFLIIEQEWEARKAMYLTIVQQIAEQEARLAVVTENTKKAEEQYNALLAQIEELNP